MVQIIIDLKDFEKFTRCCRISFDKVSHFGANNMTGKLLLALAIFLLLALVDMMEAEICKSHQFLHNV